MKVSQSNSLWPHGFYSPWNSAGQNTGVGSLFLLQGIFPTQGSDWIKASHIVDGFFSEPQGKTFVMERQGYMHCRLFTSVSDLYLLDASSSSPYPHSSLQLLQPQCVQTLTNVYLGSKVTIFEDQWFRWNNSDFEWIIIKAGGMGTRWFVMLISLLRYIFTISITKTEPHKIICLRECSASAKFSIWIKVHTKGHKSQYLSQLVMMLMNSEGRLLKWLFTERNWVILHAL